MHNKGFFLHILCHEIIDKITRNFIPYSHFWLKKVNYLAATSVSNGTRRYRYTKYRFFH